MSNVDKERINGPRADQMKTAWKRFVETFEPLRPELYRYCRYLTRNAWDAEDLVQDTLARALVTLGCVFQEIEQPRAWLFRVASNLWIDRQRRIREELTGDVAATTPASERLSLHGREAGATLISRLSDVVGIATEYGPAKMRQSDTGSLYHSLFSPISHAVAAECRRGDRGGVPRVERREYRDEPIVVSWYDHDDGPVVRDVIRLTAEADRVAAIKFYFFSPDVFGDICGELGLTWRSNGYRYWVSESA